MLLTSRIVTLRGNAAETTTAALRVHEAANAVIEPDLHLFAGVAGTPGGTFVFSAVAESIAQLMAEGAKLNASSAWNDAVTAMIPMSTGPAEQTLRRVVAVSPGGPPETRPGTMFSLLGGQVRAEKMADALELGADAVQVVHAGAGRPSAFTVSVAGDLSQVAWLVQCDEAAQFDDMAAWADADAGYQQLAVRAAEVFLPGTVQRRLIACLA